MEVAVLVVGETCYFDGLFDEGTGTGELRQGLNGEGGLADLRELLSLWGWGGGH